LTISEQLFEEFCKFNSIYYRKIQEKEYPTPDYKIRLGCHVVYVEIKQLDQNEENKRTVKRFREDKQTGSWTGTDRRIRNKIDDARRQFKGFNTNNRPNLLVVYDNTSLAIIDSDDIKTAMYGDETVCFNAYNQNGSVNWFPTKIGFGGNRKMTSTINTSISAVSVLHKSGDKSLLCYSCWVDAFCRVCGGLGLGPPVYDTSLVSVDVSLF